MSKKFSYIFILCLFFGSLNGHLLGQCTPDTTCTDTGGEPGQICPDSIPRGVIGEAYETIVTILPPPAALVFNQTIPVLKIHLDTIQNLPDGIEYVIDNGDMYPDSLYCLVLHGIPTTAGIYPLRISVTATVELIPGIGFNQSVVDSTSVVFTVDQTSGIDQSSDTDGFKILQSSPNPFYDYTRIGYLTNKPVLAELRVFNLLGQVIYTEKLQGNSGSCYFDFSGGDLRSGTYIYSITADNNIYTGRFMKISK